MWTDPIWKLVFENGENIIMKTKKVIEFIEMCAGVVVIALGISLMMKSNLGQTAYTAFATNLSKVAGSKTGTAIIFFNLSCLLGQIILLGKNFKPIQMTQALIAYLNGQMVNVFCYNFSPIAKLVPNNYYEQWLLLLLGLFVISFGVAILRSANFLNMPLEELSYVIAAKINRPFPIVRQAFDILAIAGCFVTILLFKLDYSSIREGTWCSMLLLGSSMAFTIPATNRVLQKINKKLLKLSTAQQFKL